MINKLYREHILHLKEKYPKFKLVKKEDSRLMKFLNIFLKWICPDFMTKVTTTIGYTIYQPSSYIGTRTGYKINRHEEKHMEDYKKNPIWFTLSYVLLLPTVFTMRSHWEMNAYKVTLLVNYELHGSIKDETIDWITDYFTGSMYFWMKPFRKVVRKELELERDKIYLNSQIS